MHLVGWYASEACAKVDAQQSSLAGTYVLNGQEVLVFTGVWVVMDSDPREGESNTEYMLFSLFDSLHSRI